MNGNPDKQDAYQQILSRLGQIQNKVDSLDETNAFTLRADEDKHQESVRKIFKSSKRRAQVYLAANGSSGVQQIADHLGMKAQNVGRELKALKDEGMLELVDTSGRRDIWAKKAIDRTLRISKYLCDSNNLQPDGRLKGPAAKKK